MPGALVIAAPASGSGKTTVTLGLLRALSRRGIAVAPAKVGPDYIDPRFHEAAAGRPSVNLDGWAMRPATLDRLAGALASEDGLVVAEGVMGLFDGAATPGATGDGSTAALALRFGWPVVLVVDAGRQAQSVAALVHGFDAWRPGPGVAAVILNRVGGDRHAALLRDALAPLGIPVAGALPRDDAIHLPSRHLGLVQAGETTALDDLVDRAAALVETHLDLDLLLAVASAARAPRPARRSDAQKPLPPLGQRIAIARDDAFSFLYPHVPAGWGLPAAEPSFFSPRAGDPPPADADAVYLPGGYPELHAGRLAGNARFLHGLRAAAARGAAVYGECGGYMVLGRAMTDAAGTCHAMAGLLPLTTSFAERRLHLGYRAARLLAPTALGVPGAPYRGHEFHYATIIGEGPGTPLFSAEDAAGVAAGETGQVSGTVSGSFLHLIDTG